MKTLSIAAIGLAALLPASAAADTSLSVSKSSAEACYNHAENRQRDQRSIRECTFALDQERLAGDERVGTLVNRGILWMLSNNSESAIRDFDEALYLDPKQPEAYLNKGVTYWRIGNTAGARDMAERALALNTRKPALAYYVRGLANEESGNLRAAYDDLRKAQQLEPEWSEPAMQLKRYSVRR